METWQAITLVGAVITTGLVAGALFAFVCSVMPGLGRADDRSFIRGFQGVDAAISYNVPFSVTFLASPLLIFVSTGLHVGTADQALVVWTIIASAFAVGTLAITGAVHIPLNRAIQAAGEPDQISDPATVRADFESRWVRWNVVRTVTATGSLVCTAVALAL